MSAADKHRTSTGHICPSAPLFRGADSGQTDRDRDTTGDGSARGARALLTPSTRLLAIGTGLVVARAREQHLTKHELETSVNGHHDSLVACELRALDSQADRRRFGATLRAVVDAAEVYMWDLDDVWRDASLRAVEARVIDDPLWKCWRAVADAARLQEITLALEWAP